MIPTASDAMSTSEAQPTGNPGGIKLYSSMQKTITAAPAAIGSAESFCSCFDERLFVGNSLILCATKPTINTSIDESRSHIRTQKLNLTYKRSIGTPSA